MWSPLGGWHWRYKWLMWPPQQVATKASSCLLCNIHGALLWSTWGSIVARTGADWGLPQRECLVNSGMLCTLHCLGLMYSYFLWRSQMDLIFLVSYIKYATYVLQFLSLYSSEMLKHQSSTLTNSTWTFSSCFCLKQSKNILVKKIYDNSSISPPFYMSAKFHFLNTIEKATGGITVSKNVNFSVKTRPLKSC